MGRNILDNLLLRNEVDYNQMMQSQYILPQDDYVKEKMFSQFFAQTLANPSLAVERKPAFEEPMFYPQYNQQGFQ